MKILNHRPYYGMSEARERALCTAYLRIRDKGFGDNIMLCFNHHVRDLCSAAELPFRQMFHVIRRFVKNKRKFSDYFGGLSPGDWDKMKDREVGFDLTQEVIDAAHNIVFISGASTGRYVIPSSRDGFVATNPGFEVFRQALPFYEEHYCGYAIVVMGKDWVSKDALEKKPRQNWHGWKSTIYLPTEFKKANGL